MAKKDYLPNVAEPWKILQSFTTARINLGRAGISLPTSAHLEFQRAHAQAKDAVNIPLDFDKLENSLHSLGHQTLRLQTQANNQQIFLQRPDKGRLLDSVSIKKIKALTQQLSQIDIVLIIADGLSSTAIENHAVLFTREFISQLSATAFTLYPVFIVQHGRVAIGDHIAELLSAKICIVLIGERPGLSSPDSMGIYFTYQAKQGTSDAQRNCISNIHQHGLSYQNALQKLMYLIRESDRLKLSGVQLKDETLTEASVDFLQTNKNFLLE